MTESERASSGIVGLLLPLVLVLTALGGGLLVTYGLWLFDPTSSQAEAGPVGSPPTLTLSVEDASSITADPPKPAIRVGALTLPEAAARGQEVIYSVTASNVGEVALGPITVTDSLRGDLSASFPPTLTPGESRGQAFSWVVPADASDLLIRTVTVYAAAEGQVVSHTAEVRVALLKAAVAVDATVSPAAAVPGEPVSYTVTLRNVGQVDLEAVTVTDLLEGGLSASFPSTLTVGAWHRQSFIWTAPSNDLSPLTRTVAVRGSGVGEVVSDTATTVLNLAGISVSASGPAWVWPGERATATVTVTNTSSTSAPDLVLETVVDHGRELVVPPACRVLTPGEICTFGYEIGVPPEDDVWTSSLDVRYRPRGLATVIEGGAEHTVAVVPPWQKGTGIPAGAEVRALAVCPANADLLYASFHNGRRGVYWSGDAGLSWTATDLVGEDVFGIAVDPRDCNIVYAGTRRQGVIKSEDGGRSWSALSQGLGSPFVYTVALDPTEPDVVYAGTARRGVYRSYDGGATWRAWGLALLPVVDLGVTADGETVYAATWGAGVHRRPGRSRTASAWRAVNEGIAEEHRAVCDVAVDLKDGSAAFAATASGGVYQTLDGGRTWRRGLPSPQAAYTVAVDPEYDETVYAGTAQGPFRSVSGGDPGSWESFKPDLGNVAVWAVAIGPRAEVVHLGTADGAWRHRR